MAEKKLRIKEWSFPKIPWRTVALFLAVLGPGIITANVDNDAGGITTYSVAGAQFGYHLLFWILVVTISLIVVQEMCARMGAVTQKGLADLIREGFGVKTTFFVLLCLIVADIGNTMAEFSGVAWAGQVFGISKYIIVPTAAVLVWLLVLKWNYKSVERIFLIACSIYLVYLPSVFLAHPDWHKVWYYTFVPTFSLNKDYLLMFIGVIGTTIAPWMQFYIQSAVVEKGIGTEDYPYSRLDVIVGCIMTDVVAWFIIVACGATLFVHHITIQTGADAALALKPLAGKYCTILFGVGLLNASIFSASILPLATSYYVCEAFGFESGIDRKFKQAPVFYTLYTLMILIGAGVVLIPHVNLEAILLLSQVANGILLPFILIYMLLLINNKKLMGKYVNSPVFNWIAWTTTIIMIGLTLALLVTSIPGL